jgi:hypothetical protein
VRAFNSKKLLNFLKRGEMDDTGCWSSSIWRMPIYSMMNLETQNPFTRDTNPKMSMTASWTKKIKQDFAIFKKAGIQ